MSQAEAQRRFRRKRRLEAIAALGAECAWCQEDDPRVLQIDHVDPLNQSRGRPSGKSERDAILGLDANLQLLCANCHAIKTWHS